jgi:hypothetical protein
MLILAGNQKRTFAGKHLNMLLLYRIKPVDGQMVYVK